MGSLPSVGQKGINLDGVQRVPFIFPAFDTLEAQVHPCTRWAWRPVDSERENHRQYKHHHDNDPDRPLATGFVAVRRRGVSRVTVKHST